MIAKDYIAVGASISDYSTETGGCSYRVEQKFLLSSKLELQDNHAKRELGNLLNKVSRKYADKTRDQVARFCKKVPVTIYPKCMGSFVELFYGLLLPYLNLHRSDRRLNPYQKEFAALLGDLLCETIISHSRRNHHIFTKLNLRRIIRARGI